MSDLVNMKDFRNLRRKIIEHFDLEELEILAFDLLVDWNSLLGEGRQTKTQSLISFMARRGRLNDLLALLQEMRPQVNWTTSPSEDQFPRMNRPLVYKSLKNHFTLEEIRTVCFLLDIDYDKIYGSTHNAKTEELLTYIEMSERNFEFFSILSQQRPFIDWKVAFNINEVYSERVFPQQPAQILEYVAEAKLILVGDGNVGKTSLVNRLVYQSFNIKEKITRGVAITRWNLELPCLNNQNARINIWDFGGQGNMHATHPYFFSRQAVYLLVLNVREDERIRRADYWLRLIRAYGGDSPIIIVANKSDQFSTLLDQLSLKDKYPQISGFVRTSCKEDTGLTDLKSEISKAVCLLNEIGSRTPKSLVKVQRILEDLTDRKTTNAKDTLSMDEYEEICDQNGVLLEQRLGFLRRLNDLGTMLYFGDDPRLGLKVVLNPFWVTEGIYTIINHEPLVRNGGKLDLHQIRKILPKTRYPYDKALYILDMMRKFELCFALDEQELTFLLPDLLPPQQPELPEFDRKNALKLQFEYPIWQGTILTRLIVRLHRYLIDNIYWRNGVLFQSFDKKNRALIIADEIERRLHIWIDGELSTRRNFLNRIREELDVIHQGQRSEDVKELVITPEGGAVSYPLLVNLESKGIEKHFIEFENKVIEINVKALLGEVLAEEIPNTYRLKELITERLSLDELDDLLFKFKTSLEDIEGIPTRDSKARNLIRQFERTGRMPELMAVLRDLRKDMPWV